jgi:hypothetical protein
MRNHYHETIRTTPQLRIQYEADAKSQDDRILNFLREHSYRDWTANELRDRIGEPMLLTSIRRALTNLEGAELIRQVGERKGEYRRKVGVYSFR